MNEIRTTAAIILAAGSSSRMGGGQHKLLLPLDERPVLSHVLETALTSLARPIILVLGHQANQVRAQIAPYTIHPVITIVENPNYLQGMSASMRMGLEVLIGDAWHPQGVPLHFHSSDQGQVPMPDSALIMLGDQPLITPEIIDTLISRWQTSGKRIIAPLYAGKRGNPTLFAASLFPELLEISGDEGGRSLVERYRDELETVELGDATANYDVDTWEAYQQVLEAWEKKKSE